MQIQPLCSRLIVRLGCMMHAFACMHVCTHTCACLYVCASGTLCLSLLLGACLHFSLCTTSLCVHVCVTICVSMCVHMYLCVLLSGPLMVLFCSYWCVDTLVRLHAHACLHTLLTLCGHACASVCMCLFARMSLCMGMLVHLCVCICLHTLLFLCGHACVCVHLFTCACLSLHGCACVPLFARMPLSFHGCVCVSACLHAHLSLSAYLHLHVWDNKWDRPTTRGGGGAGAEREAGRTHTPGPVSLYLSNEGLIKPWGWRSNLPLSPLAIKLRVQRKAFYSPSIGGGLGADWTTLPCSYSELGKCQGMQTVSDPKGHAKWHRGGSNSHSSPHACPKHGSQVAGGHDLA
uniref:Uncharacterized protein n=1 Tax=Pelusios castaneus TaxID=367368 RepID=A0A8C8SQC4_9SAUR